MLLSDLLISVLVTIQRHSPLESFSIDLGLSSQLELYG